jgi:hypothetical protein
VLQDEAGDLAQRRVVLDEQALDHGDGVGRAHFAKQLRLLDGVDAQVGLHVEVGL